MRIKLNELKLKSRKGKPLPGMLPNQGTIVLSGKTNSGKSTLVRDILLKKRDMFSYGYCISETEFVNKTYSNHIPRNLIDDTYKESKLSNVVEFQKKNWLKSNKTSRMVLIMDDCMSDKSFLKDKSLRKLFLECRHYGILFILCTQYFMDVPKSLRQQCEYISFGAENNIETRRIFYKQFFGFFPNFRDFDEVFKKYTSNFCVIFIKGSGGSYEIKENMFYYKSKSIDRNDNYKYEFRIGSPSIWTKCHNKGGGYSI